MFKLLRKALGVVFILGALFCLLQVNAIDSWSDQFPLGIGFLVLAIGLVVAARYLLLGTISYDEPTVPEFVRPEFVPVGSSLALESLPKMVATLKNFRLNDNTNARKFVEIRGTKNLRA